MTWSMKDWEGSSSTLQRMLGTDAEQTVRDITGVMDTASGRRFMARLIWDYCGLEHIVFNEKVMTVRDGLAEAIHGAHKDGARAVGRDLKILLAVVPSALRKAMTDEAYAEAERLDAINIPWASNNLDDRA